jgi:hypothetical protein
VGGLGLNEAGWQMPHGNVLRYDTGKPFRDPRSWAAVDKYIHLPPATVQFDTCFTAQYNRQKPFKDPGSWEIFNLATWTAMRKAIPPASY